MTVKSHLQILRRLDPKPCVTTLKPLYLSYLREVTKTASLLEGLGTIGQIRLWESCNPLENESSIRRITSELLKDNRSCISVVRCFKQLQVGVRIEQPNLGLPVIRETHGAYFSFLCVMGIDEDTCNRDALAIDRVRHVLEGNNILSWSRGP